MADRGELRLFIAIDLPSSMKDALAKAIDALRVGLRGPYRWVSPQGIHLTLKFLGDVAAERVPAIEDAMAGAVVGHGRFALALDGTGTFPANRSPSVVWAGLGGGLDNLGALQRSVEESLVPLGFAEERRTFSPHLTVARVRDRLSRGEADALASRLAEVRYEGAEAFEVSKVSLIRSELGPGGARYTTLAEASLGSG